MKQFVIDISDEPAPGTNGRSLIKFWKKNSWDAACHIEQGSDHHENHFGCYIGSTQGKDRLSIDTVEHAEKLIGALELAIQENWLFTEAQIKQHKTKSTDTRGSLRRKIKG